MKEYQVWLTLEEWDGDDKICDIETNHLGTCRDEDDARFLWDTASAHAFIVRDSLPIKIYDDVSIDKQESEDQNGNTKGKGKTTGT